MNGVDLGKDNDTADRREDAAVMNEAGVGADAAETKTGAAVSAETQTEADAAEAQTGAAASAEAEADGAGASQAAAHAPANEFIREPASDRALLGRLFTYVRPHWRIFALGVAAMVLTASTEPALPAIMQFLLDDGFGDKGNPHLMWTAPLLIIGLFLARGVFTFTMNYAMNEVSNAVLFDLRRVMFDRLVQMPVSYFSSNPAGTIIARLVNDVQNVTQSLASVLIIMVRDSCVIMGLLGWLLYLNWQLTMIAFVLIPMVALAVGAFSRRMRRLSGEQLRYTGELTSVVGEAIHGNPVIKVYAGQEHERNRFASASRQLQAFARRMTVASALIVPITQVMAAVAVSVVIALALYQSQQDRTTVGGFVSFLTAMLMIFNPLKHLAEVNGQLQRAFAAADAVFHFIDEPIEHDHGTQVIERAKGGLRFEDVRFGYAGSNALALKGIDLDIEPGETVALVGGSGGGKTTLANLIPRHGGTDSARWRAHRIAEAGEPAPADRLGEPAGDAVQRHHRQQRGLRQPPGCLRGGGAGRAGGRLPHRLRGLAAAGHQHDDRRQRHSPVRWPAPAPVHRPGAAQECPHPGAGRSHLGTGQRVRALRAGSAGRAAAWPDHPHHCAPAVHHREGRPHSGAG